LLGNNAAFGTGTVTFSGGKISSDGASARTLSNALGLSGSLALGDGTNTGALTLSGAATLSAATTLTVASGVTLSGIVSGAYDLTKAGAAELTLSGVNTFSGATVVDAGTLTLNGGSALANSMAVTVNASGTLKLASSEEIATLAGAGAVNGEREWEHGLQRGDEWDGWEFGEERERGAYAERDEHVHGRSECECWDGVGGE
jgi:fibronectin-binding autotransporter adhesin